MHYDEFDKTVINDNFPALYEQHYKDREWYKILFEQYKMSSEMARDALDRRIEINKFFVAAFGGAAAAIAVSIKLFTDQPILIAIICMLLSGIGAFMAQTWRAWIIFLIDQSSCRQEVLQAFEEKLPASHWRAINARLYTQGIDSKKLERAMPIVFQIASLTVFLVSFASLAVNGSKYFQLPSLGIAPNHAFESVKPLKDAALGLLSP